MKIWIPLCAALAIAGSACSIAQAQTDAGQPGPEGPHGGRGALRAACQADIEKFCADVAKGGGHVMQCIREHQDQLSDSCQSAVQGMGDQRRQHDGASEAPPAAPPSPQG
jgi:hypothetical protein